MGFLQYIHALKEHPSALFSYFFLYFWKLFLFNNEFVRFHPQQPLSKPQASNPETSLTSLYGYNAGFLDLFGRTVDLDGFPETGPRPRSKDAHLSHVCIYTTVL